MTDEWRNVWFSHVHAFLEDNPDFGRGSDAFEQLDAAVKIVAKWPVSAHWGHRRILEEAKGLVMEAYDNIVDAELARIRLNAYGIPTLNGIEMNANDIEREARHRIEKEQFEERVAQRVAELKGIKPAWHRRAWLAVTRFFKRKT